SVSSYGEVIGRMPRFVWQGNRKGEGLLVNGWIGPPRRFPPTAPGVARSIDLSHFYQWFCSYRGLTALSIAEPSREGNPYPPRVCALLFMQEPLDHSREARRIDRTPAE